MKFNSEENIDTSIPYAEALECLTVKRLKFGFGKMNCTVSSDYRKHDLIRVISLHVKNETNEVWEVLSETSKDLMRQLMAAGKGVGIMMPNLLELQKAEELQDMMLVISCDVQTDSYQEKGMEVLQMATKLFLFDEVYDAFKNFLDSEPLDAASPNETPQAIAGLEDLLKESMGDTEHWADFEKMLEKLKDLSKDFPSTPNKVSPFDSKYCCSVELVADIRNLEPDAKAKVLILFHKLLLKQGYWAKSMFAERFDETFQYVNIRRGKVNLDDDSLMWLRFAENDFDNIITDIDYHDPMTFFDIARTLEVEIRKFQKGSQHK